MEKEIVLYSSKVYNLDFDYVVEQLIYESKYNDMTITIIDSKGNRGKNKVTQESEKLDLEGWMIKHYPEIYSRYVEYDIEDVKRLDNCPVDCKDCRRVYDKLRLKFNDNGRK